jgi:hypothetical protein
VQRGERAADRRGDPDDRRKRATTRRYNHAFIL